MISTLPPVCAVLVLRLTLTHQSILKFSQYIWIACNSSSFSLQPFSFFLSALVNIVLVHCRVRDGRSMIISIWVDVLKLCNHNSWLSNPYEFSSLVSWEESAEPKLSLSMASSSELICSLLLSWLQTIEQKIGDASDNDWSIIPRVHQFHVMVLLPLILQTSVNNKETTHINQADLTLFSLMTSGRSDTLSLDA